jgi:hypothetical protein
VFDFLKLARIVMAATFLAVAFASSPAGAQQSQGTTITDKSPTGELTFWNSVKDSPDVLGFKTYLENFPNGMFYDLALAKYKALGGNIADLKPIAKGNLAPANSGQASSSGTGNPPKPKMLIAKEKTSILHKRVVFSKIWKGPRVHFAKKLTHKHIVTHHKRKKRRKVSTPSNDPFGRGGGGGGGGGGGWGH